MSRRGSPIASFATIFSALSVACVLSTHPVRAEPVPAATCTGEADIPWSAQIAGCTAAITSGKYAGKDLAKVLILRGKAYGQTGDMDRCLADIDAAIRLDPTNAFAVGGRGDIYMVKRDYAHALADYTQSATLDPNNASVFVGRGMAYLATHDLDHAEADFEQAIRLQPKFASGLYWRGVARRLKGDVAAGDADIAAARTIDPAVR